QDVLRRRSHTVEVIGFGHTVARGMKAGSVVDLSEAEQALRQALDLAERAAKMQLESVVVSLSGGKPATDLMSATATAPGRTAPACSPPAARIRCGPAGRCCIRCRSGTRSTRRAESATRAACSAAASASTCT